MVRYARSHSQKLKEEIWLMRLHRFCGSYRPMLLPALLSEQQFQTSI